ncbi:MAG: hypothetical protein RLZZ524_2380, partial [Pseudomonadota bacterium]
MHHVRRLPRSGASIPAVVASMALSMTMAVWAKCAGAPDDVWKAQDKVMHAGAGFLPAVIIGEATKDPWLGFWAGVGISAAVEVIGAASGGVCSPKDFMAGFLGAAIGAGTAHWIIQHQQG